MTNEHNENEEVKEQTVFITAPPAEEEDSQPGCPGWMVTFGDSISLLLTFFVLMLAFSKFDNQAVKNIISFGASLGFGVHAVGGAGGMVSDITGFLDLDDVEQGKGALEYVQKTISDVIEVSNREDVKFSYKELQQYFSTENLQASVAIEDIGQGSGFAIAFDSDFMFAPGKAYITQKSKKSLEKIASLIADLPNDILIEVYSSDYNSIAYPVYASNVDLAVARAAMIANMFSEFWSVDSERIGIQGYSIESDTANKPENDGGTKARVAISIISEFSGYMRKELASHG